MRETRAAPDGWKTWRATPGSRFPAPKVTQRLVFGVDPHDPRTLGGSASLLLAVGVVAAIAPALRASRIDPIEAIRAE
jgi:hypothetical protein